jgi:DNA repair protein RadC
MALEQNSTHHWPMRDLPTDMRPREKLLARGPAALSDSELLALLLRTGTPGRNVLQMASELLGQFGGISGLLKTQAKDLQAFKGLGGTAKRAELMAVLELSRRAMAEQLAQRPVFDSPERVKQYLQMHLAHKDTEVFAVLLLNAQHHLLHYRPMFEGTLGQTSVYPREVVKLALDTGASAVVLAHNHPSGHVQPSGADQALTKSLKSALALVDVRVLDHIIVAPGKAFSMAENHWL